jgi:hypothetical protein
MAWSIMEGPGGWSPGRVRVEPKSDQTARCRLRTEEAGKRRRTKETETDSESRRERWAKLMECTGVSR